MRLDALLVVRELALKGVLAVMVACFPLSAVTMLVPATVSDPPIVAFPPTASVEFKTAAPSACSSRNAMTSRPCISALHVTLAIDSCEVELMDTPAFAAIVVIMLVPFKYSGPATSKDDPITAEPLMSIDGALTAQENTALLADIPSRSTLLASARDRVVDAGLIRAQVSSLSCSVDVELSNACFALNGYDCRGRCCVLRELIQHIYAIDHELPCNRAVPI